MIEIEEVQKGKLYIVALPIGNRKDITIRALEILKSVDVILAEDTRVLAHLLSAYRLVRDHIYSYYSYNESEMIPRVLDFLKYKSVALVSDAGTPLISDPGHILIKTLIEKDIPMTCIPGANAIATSLPLSGFPLEDFYFLGFLSPKNGKKRNQIEKVKNIATVFVVYESSHRIVETIKILWETLGDIPVFIGRELTKIHETLYRGMLSNIYYTVSSNNFVCKGEFVIIINNKQGPTDSSKDSG